MNQTIEQTTNYFETMFKEYASQANCIQAIFAVNDDILLEYGLEIHPKPIMRQMIEDLKKFDLLANLLSGKIRFSKITTIEKETQKYDIYTYSIEKNKRIFRSIFLLPTGQSPSEIDFQPLNNLVLNYYLNLPQFVDYKYIETYSEFIETITKEISGHFTSLDEVGVISHFYIQDLNNYYRNMSQQYADEVHKQIRLGILRYLKKGDLLFRVNQRSYITYSHNCNIETVKKRFSDIYFQLNTLMIRYQLFFHQNNANNYRSKDFWTSILSCD